MARIFSLNVEVDTSASENTALTAVGLKLANTAGHRLQLRRVHVAGGGQTDSPVDQQLKVQIRRTDNTTDGTSTNVLSTIFQHDPNSLATIVSAAGAEYTVEPTTISTPVGPGGGFNGRGQLVLAWEPGTGPVAVQNTTLLIQVEQSDTTAVELVVYVEWEEF